MTYLCFYKMYVKTYRYFLCIRFNERNKSDIKVLDHESLGIPNVNKQAFELFIVF